MNARTFANYRDVHRSLGLRLYAHRKCKLPDLGEALLTRHRPRLHAAQHDNTLKSLDRLLGSKDSLDEDETVGAKGGDKPPTESGSNPGGTKGRPSLAVEAGPARVRPLYVYVIYYCYLVVYLAAAWLQATEGDLAASDLVDGLVNDHLAVASGQVPRLATYGFVCEGPLSLFMQLATLATVGAEAEALLGYGSFWALFWMANLGGGLADAALSELPVTAGPANGAAGIVGALAAFYVRNWGLEERIEEARQRARGRRQRELAGQLGPHGSGDGGGSGSESGMAESDEKGATPALSADRDSLEDAETEVEVLPMLSFTINTRLSARARGLLNVLVALVVAGQGLLEFGGASSSASWIGVAASAWTGAVLAFGAGPQYEVRYMISGGSSPGATTGDEPTGPQKSVADSAGRVEPAGGSARTVGAGATAATGSTAASPRREAGPRADADGLVVEDVCPPSRRRAVLGGYLAGLGGLICAWLAWMGTDI